MILLCSSLIDVQLPQISLAEGRVDRLYWRSALDNVGHREGGVMLGGTAWYGEERERGGDLRARDGAVR
jgi:hypothetical protein